MDDWRQTALRFLEQWISQDFVDAVILTGSMVTKYHDSHSDIDIHIVLTERTGWRERGNLIMDGHVIEYFANPARVIRKYMEEDYRQNKRTDARMFSMGESVFDRNNVISALKKEALQMMKKPFPMREKAWIESAKYQIWDLHDNLASLYDSEDLGFDAYYYTFLSKTYESYCVWSGEEIIPLNKLTRYVSNPDYRRAYLFDAPKDIQFYAKLLECLKAADRKVKFNQATLLSNYVLNKMEGFEIDGWHLRSDIPP